MKPKRHHTSTVSAVLLLIAIEKITWLMRHFSTTTHAVIAHCAPLLEKSGPTHLYY